MSTLDDVISTVLRAREDGPDALAAVALSFGSAMELGTLGNTALKARLAETRAALEAAEATVATLRTERDAAREALAPDLDHLARAEVWRLRESVAALRARAERAEAERDAAVQEREAFSLRLSAAERERDEARAERDALRDRPTYEARTTMPTPEELAAHDAAGGGWLVSWDGERYRRAEVFWAGFDPSEWANAGLVWIAFDADGLPCAWPVVP